MTAARMAPDTDASTADPCPICSGESATKYGPLSFSGDAGFVFDFSIQECRDCRAQFVSPLPTDDDIPRFYSDSYGPYVPSATPAGVALKYWLARSRYKAGSGARKRASEGVAKLVEASSGRGITHALGIPLGLEKSASILEIGFGGGGWLLEMHRLGYRNLAGFDVGDLSKRGVPLTDRGIAVYGGALTTEALPMGAFDLVRLEHVFEHIPTPHRALAAIASALKPGGRLVMSFPCAESLSLKLFGTNCTHLDAPRHVIHHTRRSIQLALDKAGLTLTELKLHGEVKNFLASAGQALSVPRLRLLAPFLSPSYFQLCNLVGLGEFMSVSAEKPL